jgi:hypothetical protein
MSPTTSNDAALRALATANSSPLPSIRVCRAHTHALRYLHSPAFAAGLFAALDAIHPVVHPNPSSIFRFANNALTLVATLPAPPGPELYRWVAGGDEPMIEIVDATNPPAASVLSPPPHPPQTRPMAAKVPKIRVLILRSFFPC